MKLLTKRKILLGIGLAFVLFWILKALSSMLLQHIYYSYLLIISNIALQILNHTGNNIHIIGDTLIINPSISYTLTLSLISKTWVFLILGIIWITPNPIKSKYFYSIIPFVVHFISSVISICLLVVFLQKGYEGNDVLLMTKTVVSTCFKLFLFFWIYKHRVAIIEKIASFGINKQLVILVSKNLMILLLLTLLFNNFFIAFFQFDWLVWFLFNSSQKILHLFGYLAVVNGQYLLGNNGNIHMDKYCMGIWLMFYFTAFIILTGSKIKPRLWYIFIGIVAINIINIARFVFLFINLQKHGNYDFAVDFHDLFNYAVYAFIFISWVIWIEFFSDIWEYLKPGINDPKKENIG
jgi:exosortase/archaeosortase family protein